MWIKPSGLNINTNKEKKLPTKLLEDIIEKLWSRFLQEKTQKVPKNSQTNPLGLGSPKYFHYEHFIQTNKFMNTVGIRTFPT